jgi:RecT family
MVDISEIERRVDRAVTAAIPVSVKLGGIDPENYGQVMEFAKAMSTCRAGIPAWLRGSIGDCLMICTRALRWGMDPFFVAEKSFAMESKSGEVRVGYESQLVHAVIESLAPIKGRLRHEYRGEGDDTVCVVYGTFKGEDTPHEYISEPLGKRIKDIGRSQQGNFRGSPLWLTKPRVQLFYDASRDWARINCPDVLAGVYTKDELPDHEPVDVTPSKLEALQQKLRNAREATVSRGFTADGATNARNSVVEGEANPGDAKQEGETNERVDESDIEGQQADTGDRVDGDRDQSGSADGGDNDRAMGGESAGEEGAEQDQKDIFPPDRKTKVSPPPKKTRR